MKLEVGKFYKTRNGFKARIYATDGRPGAYQAHGAILITEHWSPYQWRTDGMYYESGDFQGNDLVAEWVNPKPRRLAYLNDFGQIVFWPEDQIVPKEWYPNRERAPWLDEPVASHDEALCASRVGSQREPERK